MQYSDSKRLIGGRDEFVFSFTLFGGLAFFIYGMNQMSHSLERIAGSKMERIINKMTRNRLSGLLMGCIITIAIQSSSAVTVMLVGLVNSGLMNIGNTVAVIMGSNIGTTITAWLVLADILNNYERISDHCSNIAIAVIQADSDIYDPHEYIKNLHANDDM